MKQGSLYRRNVAALALVANAALSVLYVALQPPLGTTPQSRLEAIAAAGAPATVSAVAFVLAQLPLLVGLLGVAHLLRPSAPKLGTTAASIGAVGAFGHTVTGSVLLTEVLMAGDAVNRAAIADFVGQLNQSPVMLFSLIGLAGTVVGLLLLGIALWRSRLVARWVPVLLWAFLVLEFVGGAVSAQASYLASVCGLVALGALALAVWRSPRSAWAFVEAPAEVLEDVAGTSR